MLRISDLKKIAVFTVILLTLANCSNSTGGLPDEDTVNVPIVASESTMLSVEDNVTENSISVLSSKDTVFSIEDNTSGNDNYGMSDQFVNRFKSQCVELNDDSKKLKNDTQVMADYFSGTIYFQDSDNENDLPVAINAKLEPVVLESVEKTHLNSWQENSKFYIELRDSLENIVAKLPVNDFGITQYPALINTSNEQFFYVWIKNPPAYRSYAIMENDTELDVIQKSDSILEVSHIEPRACEIHKDRIEVSWRSNGLHDTILRYDVLYSSDGGKNYTLFSEDQYEENFILTSDAIELVSSSQAKIKIVVSDGTKSSIVESEIFMFVGVRPVVLLTSLDERNFTIGESLKLQAIGFDQSGEELNYIWLSDIDGRLGESNDFVISSTNFTPGRHKIAIAVSNSSGILTTLSKEVIFEIPDRRLNNTFQITIDSSFDDEILLFDNQLKLKASDCNSRERGLNYKWYSNFDGLLGIGCSIKISSFDLSPLVEHTVTVELANTLGASVSASRKIKFDLFENRNACKITNQDTDNEMSDFTDAKANFFAGEIYFPWRKSNDFSTPPVAAKFTQVYSSSSIKPLFNYNKNSSYTIELYDVLGHKIADFPVYTTFPEHPQFLDGLMRLYFNSIISNPPDYHSVALLRQDRELARIRKFENVLSATVAKPKSGELVTDPIELSWKNSRMDGKKAYLQCFILKTQFYFLVEIQVLMDKYTIFIFQLTRGKHTIYLKPM